MGGEVGGVPVGFRVSTARPPRHASWRNKLKNSGIFHVQNLRGWSQKISWDSCGAVQKYHSKSMSDPICCWAFDIPSKSKTRRVFLSQNNGVPSGTVFTRLHDDFTSYHPYCDDFGPLNLASITTFIQRLDIEIENRKSEALLYLANQGRRNLTNAVFLLGAYMTLKLNMSPSEISSRFGSIDRDKIEGYRDATFSAPDFFLELSDCWSAIGAAVKLRWLSLPHASHPNLLTCGA